MCGSRYLALTVGLGSPSTMQVRWTCLTTPEWNFSALFYPTLTLIQTQHGKHLFVTGQNLIRRHLCEAEALTEGHGSPWTMQVRWASSSTPISSVSYPFMQNIFLPDKIWWKHIYVIWYLPKVVALRERCRWDGLPCRHRNEPFQPLRQFQARLQGNGIGDYTLLPSFYT